MNIEIVKPCHNECIRKGTEKLDQPIHMGAVHGNFCDREYFAARIALEDVAELIEHVISLVTVKGASDDNVQATKEAPLPFNTQAFNDANELYGRLVYWARHWGGLMKRQVPAAAKRSWSNERGVVIGLPFDVAPAAARYASSTMSIWLRAHLDDIFDILPADDVDYFVAELRDVYRVSARWPSKMKARFAKIPCPGDCRGRIAVYPPVDFGDDMRVVCERCSRVFGEDEFEHEIRVFKQMQEEARRAGKVVEHLTGKYVA